MTYPCMTKTGMDAESSAKGLLMNIRLPSKLLAVFSNQAKMVSGQRDYVLVHLLPCRNIAVIRSVRGLTLSSIYQPRLRLYLETPVYRIDVDKPCLEYALRPSAIKNANGDNVCYIYDPHGKYGLLQSVWKLIDLVQETG